MLVNAHLLLFLLQSFATQMDKFIITIIIVTIFLAYRLIVSTRKQEGYKRWKAGAGGAGNNVADTSATRKAWNKLRDNSFFNRKKAADFDDEAVTWCVGLLGVEEEKLRDLLDNVSRHYQSFWMGKRSGGFRMIQAPDGDLKSVQTTIYQRILLPVNVHPAATGFRPQKSTTDNARPHLGNGYVLKTDIHDFFGSIRSTRVKKIFEEMGYPRHISKVLGTLCCVNWHLPQGACTSPALSNIVAYSMDKKLAALAVEHGLTYTRYADDLTFSGNYFDKELFLTAIKQIVEEEKFELNHKKTRFMGENKRKIITGVSVSSGTKLTIPKAKKREIRKHVHFILTKGLAEHQRFIGSKDPVYLKRLLGMLCYWRSIEPENRYVSDSIEALKRLKVGCPS